MNTLTDSQRESFGARAAAVDFLPIVLDGTRTFQLKSGWDRLLEAGRLFTAHNLNEIEAQLTAHEARQAERERQRIPVREALPEGAPDPISDFVGEHLEASRAAFEYRHSAEGRQERMIGLLEQILAALEQRVR